MNGAANAGGEDYKRRLLPLTRDALGRITTLDREDGIYALYSGGGLRQSFTYTSKDELKTAQTSQFDSPGVPMPGRSLGLTFAELAKSRRSAAEGTGRSPSGNGNNRLINQTSVLAHPEDGMWRELCFVYDYLGRRVRKTVAALIHPGGDSQWATTTAYVYWEWHLLAEVNYSPHFGSSLIRSYTWGLDKEGVRPGAGGVGGLLQVTDHATSKTYYALNDYLGNVIGLVDGADGSVAAAYEYDPFGRELRATGDYAAANPFRFSSQYTDTESGLVYFGFRYYHPEWGRFLNRDPIEEEGGKNLYRFVSNDPVNRWDLLGLTDGTDEDALANNGSESIPEESGNDQEPVSVNPVESTISYVEKLGSRSPKGALAETLPPTLRITSGTMDAQGNIRSMTVTPIVNIEILNSIIEGQDTSLEGLVTESEYHHLNDMEAYFMHRGKEYMNSLVRDGVTIERFSELIHKGPEGMQAAHNASHHFWDRPRGRSYHTLVDGERARPLPSREIIDQHQIRNFGGIGR